MSEELQARRSMDEHGVSTSGDAGSNPVAPASARARQRRRERVAKGLCPNDGNQAAPYYLCGRCRGIGMISRIMKKGTAVDAVTVEKRSGKNWYKIGATETLHLWKYREAKEGDARLRPRIRNIPVDIEAELIELFKKEDRPLTEDEVYSAWGRMRLRGGRTSAVADMAAIPPSHRRSRK